MVLRLLRKIRFSRSSKRKTMPPILTTTTPMSLTTALSVALTTIGNDDNTTDVQVPMETTRAVSKSRMPGEMELLSLTETMGIVAGIVCFIVVMVMLCFVYRTKLRSHVRMRAPVDRDRRSAATSLDLLDLNEYDQRIRLTAGVRLPPTVSSPVYGRQVDTIEGTEPAKSKPLPNSKPRGVQGVVTEENEYYNVVLNNTTDSNLHQDDLDSDINANDVFNRTMESFKGKPSNIAVDKKVDITDEKLNAENVALLSHGDGANKKEFIADGEETVQNVDEVDSVDSPPPTPCSERSYINIDSIYVNEEEYSKQGYINVDYRDSSMPLVDVEEDRNNTAKMSKGKNQKKGRSKAKHSISLIEHGEVNRNKTKRSNGKTNIKGDKPQMKTKPNAKEKQFGKNKPTWSVSVDSGQDHYYLPMDSVCESDTNYVPMDSKGERDVNYVPMDCNVEDQEDVSDNVYIFMENNDVEGQEDVADNVYIFMESNDSTNDYINCATRDIIYENQ